MTMQGRMNILERQEKAEAEAVQPPQLNINSVKIAQNRYSSQQRRSSARIKSGQVIDEESHEEQNQQESGSGTVHSRLYKESRKLVKKRQEEGAKAEEDKVKSCSFQPNKGLVRKSKKKKKDTEEEVKQTPKEIGQRLY